MSKVLLLLIFSAVAVVYLFFISKLLGKKQIAQLEFIDYVIGISIGSIAAEMATDTSDTPFYHYLIAMTIFFLFDILVTFLGRKGRRLKNFLKGKPITVVYDGKIEFEQLKKSKLDVNELLGLCREMGYFDLNQVAFAIFENSGKLSVMPKSKYSQLTAENLKLKLQKAKLPNIVVVDGCISYSTLRTLKKDESWLFAKLKISNKKQLKNIIFAEWDEKQSEMIVHTKN